MQLQQSNQRTKITEERRKEILANLQRERESRRKIAQEMNLCQPYPASKSMMQKDLPLPDPNDILQKHDDFAENSDLPSEHFAQINTEDFKDPNDILMAPPDMETYDMSDKPTRSYDEHSLPTGIGYTKEDLIHSNEKPKLQRSDKSNKSGNSNIISPHKTMPVTQYEKGPREIFESNLMKECLDYTTKSDNSRTPGKSTGRTPSRKPAENEETQLIPQQTVIRPEEPPVRAGPFSFDQKSKIAQEIQKKYKPMNKPPSSVTDKTTAANEARFSKHEQIPTNKPPKRPMISRTRADSNKENPPTYMKPTAIAGLRTSRSPDELPEKIKKVALEQEQRIREQCTFKPNINVGEFETKLEMNRNERISRLYKPKTTEIQKREKLKQQRDDEEFAQVCTFQPKKHVQSTSFIEVKARANLDELDQPVQERLYYDANKRLEDLRKAYREKEAQELEGCTFKPNVVESTKHVTGNRLADRPIHERFKEVQRERHENLQRLRMEAELKDKNLTFKPQISKRSAEMAMRRTDIGKQSVTERLCKDAAERVEKNIRKSEILNQEKSVQYPFAPRLHTSTFSIGGLGEDRLLSKGFNERQELYQQRKREKEEQKLTKYSCEAKCTFRPEINFTSEILVEADPRRGNETEEERIERLSKKDPKKQEKIKQIRENEFKSKYTYHPRINETSRTMARNHSVDDFAMLEKQKTNREKLLVVAHEKEQKECTFQPQINQTHTQSYYTKDADILQRIKEKEQDRLQKMEQKKRDIEYEEMKDCTFQPTIVQNVSVMQQEPAVVKGIGRHLELAERKKQLEKERKEREKQVFALAEKYDKRETHDTVPQPFKLSYGKQKPKNTNPQENRPKEMKECTFQPETIEKRNRKFLQNLVNQQKNTDIPEEYKMAVYE